MSKKKQNQEELIKTHVLNLAEIREAEKKEIHLKNKKLPIIFSTLGIFLIALGLVYPNLTKYFVKKDKVVVASKVEKNTLTCISNLEDKTNNVKIYTKTIYKFNNKKLASSDTSTQFSVLTGVDYSIINNLYEYYKGIYINNGMNPTYTINQNNKVLYFNSTINNYFSFDKTNYNQEINKVNHTSIFKGGESMETVKSSEEVLGNLCS